MVSLGSLFEARLVGAQLVLRGPCGAVDALQLRVLLAAAPVRARDAGEVPAVSDEARRGHVRAAAQIAPRGLAVAGDVVVDRQFARTDLCRRPFGRVRTRSGPAREVYELELERLVRHLGARLVLAHDAANEPLAFADDPLHLLLDRLEIFGSEGVGDAEVVVEAVGDRRADAEVRLRADALHGLGEHVRGRVTQDRQTVGARHEHGLDRVALGDDGGEVFQLAVHAQSDDGAVGEQGETVGGIGHVRRG